MPKLMDKHEFTIWRYEDYSIELNIHRDEFDVDPRTALMEASVVARTLAEILHEQPEVFSMRAYANGDMSTYWRNDEDFPQTWRMYRWLRSRVSQGLHGGLVRGPRLPQWMEYLIFGLEYLMLRLMRAVKKTSGRDEEENMATGQPQQTVSDQPLPDNVIPLRRPR
jgi:hypothetical protein